MKSPLRLFAKILFLLVVLALFGVGIVLAWFTSWRSDKVAELNSGSEIAQTSSGEVEFLVRGDGPPVLVFHGAPGGYDQAMLLGSALTDQGFQVIAPSRPGYLRTPLTDRLTPSRQADAMDALLNTLGAPSVAVIGFSSGGPAALEFARKYPNRTWALVLISGVTSRYNPFATPFREDPANAVLKGFKGDIGSWLAVEMAKDDPRALLKTVLETENMGNPAARRAAVEYVLGHEGQLDWFRSLIGTFAPLTPRDSGARNDMVQIRAMAEFPLGEITVPVLMIHGAEDDLIPVATARASAGKIPTATFFEVPGAGHIPQLGPHGDEVDKKITEFLRQYSGGQTQP
jgi:pimeloyl-ACP methyl ester carboxylesterase